jgi:hypothetical protein
MKTKLENKKRGELRAGRRPRKHTARADDLVLGPTPDFMWDEMEVKASKSNITADDCAWLGDDNNIDPDELLKERGYEMEGALRLILGAIIDAYPDSVGRTRAQRIDEAEDVLLGKAKKRGNDPHDDEDLLRELGRRYFRRWLEDPAHKIGVAPIAREILVEAKAAGRIPNVIVQEAFRRLQRKFASDRDRILARATVEVKWDLPEFHDRILSILKELQALGVDCDTRSIVQRIDPEARKSAN